MIDCNLLKADADLMLVLVARPITAGSDSVELLVTDGVMSCRAFSHGANVAVGETLVEPLHLFGLSRCQITEARTPLIEQIDGLAHRGVGRLERVAEPLLKSGGLSFSPDDHLPGGLQVGDWVEFECSRIDVW